MVDFNRLKKLMANSVEQRLVVLDGEEIYVMINLKEYEHLLESHKKVSQNMVDDKSSVAIPGIFAQSEIASGQNGLTSTPSADPEFMTDSFEEPEMAYENLNAPFGLPGTEEKKYL